MGAAPVKIEKVAGIQPQTCALALKVGGRAPQRTPQRLQVRVAKAEGGDETIRRVGHGGSLDAALRSPGGLRSLFRPSVNRFYAALSAIRCHKE